ncbi:COP23 domain-containing protein [Lyngbya confervoides]|uniref:COP23 domain-containing protein n=1 Tax=Lyngbya confervoides BDU141951 TaxID=1574623 RepID=A0ABD4T390_9CYAN|nr:COP23 domain-containing protein [Lyngbya confervoides]MCM1983241.1 COP23 domain-containing protein [Lyngbya confervoides BDU141951]
MKFRPFVPSLLTAVLASAAAMTAVSGSAFANPTGAKFLCKNYGGVPTTMARTSRGEARVIAWRTREFGEDYPPQVRCDIVSKRFQEFYEKGTLNFLTTGIINRQPVVCVAQHKGGACSDLLFTLRPGSNPGLTLQRLLDVRVRASGPLNESASRTYIDMEEFLATAPIIGNSTPVETTPATPDPAAAPDPATPPKASPDSSTVPVPGELW